VDRFHAAKTGITLKALELNKQHITYADWSGAEYAAALRCLLSGHVIDGKHGRQLAERFAERYFPSTAYPVNYAHTGLELALAVFRRRMPDKPDKMDVLLPAYICPSVVQTITAAGLNPVPVDIGYDLNLTPATVAQALTERTLAVVAPHMFGCPARIGAIESLCRSAGVFLIDDAAQVVGIQQDGRILGTFGDVGLISFAQSKTVVTGIRGSGGMLLVNNPALDAEIKTACENLPAPSGRIWMLLDFLWNYVWAAQTGHSGYWLGRIGDLLGLRLPVSAPGAGARISNLEASIALIQLRRLEQILASKNRVTGIYHRELQDWPGIAFPQYAPGRYLSRIMLLLPEGVDMPACRKFLDEKCIVTRLGYTVPFPSQAATGNAEALSARLLGVPCGAAVGEAEVRRICRELGEAVMPFG
jgi:dTDP-4-amino-4,6-dideoxygalactose transaminase